MMTIWDNVEPIIRVIYGIILLYFLLGGIGFYVINRKKSPEIVRRSYTKFITYFLIVNSMIICMVFRPSFFKYIAIFITIVGLLEMIRVFIKSQFQHVLFFVLSILVFFILGTGFYTFSTLPYKLVLYTFLIVSIFDSFSQITGQLWGKRKIAPATSPHKTIGGVGGGIVVAMVSAFLLSNLYEISIGIRLLLVSGIISFAFAGDLMASLYKRRYGVKDYSRLIPGHGGVLDRFDSLIMSGAWVALFNWCF